MRPPPPPPPPPTPTLSPLNEREAFSGSSFWNWVTTYIHTRTYDLSVGGLGRRPPPPPPLLLFPSFPFLYRRRRPHPPFPSPFAVRSSTFVYFVFVRTRCCTLPPPLSAHFSPLRLHLDGLVRQIVWGRRLHAAREGGGRGANEESVLGAAAQLFEGGKWRT